MAVRHIPCGETVNESERLAIQACCNHLSGRNDGFQWVLFSNLEVHHAKDFRSDEIDLVAIGPSGVFVIEVKHWDADWIRARESEATREADKLAGKARRLGGWLKARLRRADLFASPAFLLTTQGTSCPDRIASIPCFAVDGVHRLFDSQPGLALDGSMILGVADCLKPRTSAVISGTPRSIDEYCNLERVAADADGFCRIFRGFHRRTKEPVLVYWYDLSARKDPRAEDLARREFEAFRVLQKSPYIPRVREYLKSASDYPGEILYGVLFDPQAPNLERRSSADEAKWPLSDRIQFAIRSLEALASLQSMDQNFVHRNINPQTLLVSSNNEPIFTGLRFSRMDREPTIYGTGDLGPEADDPWMAPEIRQKGRGRATSQSDVYSLCRTLTVLFERLGAAKAAEAKSVLEAGCSTEIQSRHPLRELAERMAALLVDAAPTNPPTDSNQPSRSVPPLETWCEGTLVPFDSQIDLRILAKLGQGGIGCTFKVEKVVRSSGEGLGTFVAKVLLPDRDPEEVRKGYYRIQGLSRENGLATIYEVPDSARDCGILALMEWVEGEALDRLAGRLGTLATEMSERSVAKLLREWLKEAAAALHVLHAHGYVHGDVSPKNLVLSHGSIRLIDYDLVTPKGQTASSSGTPLYSSPEFERGDPCQLSDDLFALAASLFRVAFDDDPFPSTPYGIDKTKGLNWTEERRQALGELVPILEKATHPDASCRYQSAAALLADLSEPVPDATETHQNEVPWLSDLLTLYPGSRVGNDNARGVDSEFAKQTYVPTDLEERLLRELSSREVSLVILCGNAGDGKTALLQSLAQRLGANRVLSGDRVWEHRTVDGLLIRANLDGAASWRGRPADELVDDLLKPFLDGRPTEDVAHLLAINDGKLLEWILRRQKIFGDRPLLRGLLAALRSDDDSSKLSDHIRLVSLNHRSLVGGVDRATGTIDAGFFDRVIKAMLGGENAAQTWRPCETCSARSRCVAGTNARRLVASFQHDAAQSEEGVRGLRMRQRLLEAFQAVHQRGEVHITLRELRGALSYVLFGVHTCRELHDDDSLKPLSSPDLLFDPESYHRQGELLRELSHLDPALEAHPVLDRWILGRSSVHRPGAGPSYPGLPLATARRRAFLEWTEEEIAALAENSHALGLAEGRHLAEFREASRRDKAGNDELCRRLCQGIAMMEFLPRAALRRFREQGVVPLRIPGRNRTETVFWIEKPLDRFRLEPEWPPVASGLVPVLPNRLRLVYRYQSGEEEVLSMGYQLFHTLLSLSDGEQLAERRLDSLFANLRIFVQRLSLEDESVWFAWHPKGDRKVFRLGTELRDGLQVLACEEVEVQS